MAENRWRSATVASLCVQARLNKRYFYESFDDLDRLADAVIDSVAADVGGAAVAAYLATLDSPLEVQAKNTVGALVDVLGTDRRKALVLLGGVPTSAGQEDTRRAAIGGLTTILVDHARRIHDVELEQDSLAFTAPAFVIGGTAQTILSWVNGDLPVERDQLIDDIAAIWVRSAKARRIWRDRGSMPGRVRNRPEFHQCGSAGRWRNARARSARASATASSASSTVGVREWPAARSESD